MKYVNQNYQACVCIKNKLVRFFVDLVFIPKPLSSKSNHIRIAAYCYCDNYGLKVVETTFTKRLYEDVFTNYEVRSSSIWRVIIQNIQRVASMAQFFCLPCRLLDIHLAMLACVCVFSFNNGAINKHKSNSELLSLSNTQMYNK